MRPLAPTSRSHRRGTGALRPALAASGALLGLVLAALALGLWAPDSLAQQGRSHGERAHAVQAAPFLKAAPAKPDVKALTAAPGEWAAIVSAPHAFQPHAPLFSARGRTGFAPHPQQAVHTAVRERQDALVSALVRVMRYSAAPVAGFTADRPPLVTRPLRGPPSLA